MLSLREIIELENRIEYKVRKYKLPKISPIDVQNRPVESFTNEEKKYLTRKGKRWYIYYDFIDPETKKFKRQDPLYFNLNRLYPDFDERHKFANMYLKVVKDQLQKGFSPYLLEDGKVTPVKNAFTIALKTKKKEVSERTFKDYQSRIGKLELYLKNRGVRDIKMVKKHHIVSFLNQFKPTNSNNYKAYITPIFSILSEQSVIDNDFTKDIRKKKQRKKSKRIFTEEEVNEVYRLTKEQDYQLHLFFKLVNYMFWRPVEIVRMTTNSIDFENRTIKLNSKAKDGKTKLIPSIIYNELKDYCDGKEGYLFKPESVGKWNLTDDNKRNYFTLRFNRFRTKNKIDKELTMYAGRHTYITKLYISLRKEHSIEETIRILSLITGHTSKAVWAYIQVNDIELPEDYSNLL